ncbi:MAG: hypothetical protein ACR2NT_08870 [Acidimicrobiia bacterium]
MITNGKIGSALPVLGLLGIGLLVSPISALTVGTDGMLTLALPRQPAADEAVVLRLSVGVLPRQARVVVRTIDGEIAGTIAPFGVRPGREAGVHTIPIPAKAVVGDKVTLRFEILERDAQAGRFPTCAEIKEAKLVFMPVSRRLDRLENPKLD